MYFIMTKKSEITIATSKYEDVANLIAKSFTEDCIVRWAPWSDGHKEHENFSEAHN